MMRMTSEMIFTLVATQHYMRPVIQMFTFEQLSSSKTFALAVVAVFPEERLGAKLLTLQHSQLLLSLLLLLLVL